MSTHDPARKAVLTCHVDELKENVHELHFLPRWFRDRLCNQEQFNAMVTSIMAGMRPRVLDILNSGGNFSIQQLMSALEPVQSNDDRGAVYTRIYYDFQDRKRLPSQYTGTTNNLAARDSGHEGVKHIETNSNHYRTSRAANHYIMGPICLLNEEQLRTIAEQLFTCLFETYTDAVMNYQDRSGKSQSEKISDVDSYYNDREASLLLMQLARSAFKKADWPGCRSRQSYGAGDGCNWNSPITEWLKGERVIWTQLAFPDNNLLQLQRTPVQIRSGSRDSNDRIYITIEQQGSATLASRGSFEPTVPTELKLPLGTWVWPVIEMTKNGCPHPRSWARLPTKGPWYDWDAANSWALRIEFQRENGNWESTELVSAYPFRPRTAQLSWPGAFNAYAQGIARRRFFNQAVLTHQGRPVWMCDYGIARIKEQKMDWLKQTGTIVDVQPPGNIVRASRMKSQWDMQSELAAVGVNAFGAPFQSDRESTRVRKPERACDSCYLHNLDNRTRDPRTGVSSMHRIVQHLLT